MVGINADGTVAGLQVVAEDETDGIGTNAFTEEYFGGFAGATDPGAELTVDEAGAGQTHVDAVSGATFTSRAVVDCLNIAFAAYAQMGQLMAPNQYIVREQDAGISKMVHTPTLLVGGGRPTGPLRRHLA